MDDISKLRVVYSAGVSPTFTDFTEKAWDYSRAGFAAPMVAADFLMIGKRKGFCALYVEINQPNAVDIDLEAEYWNGTAWTALPLLAEDTAGFQRSGFIKWAIPADWAIGSDQTGCPQNATNFWLRFSVDLSLTNTTAITGINLVFADDNDLRILNWQIDDFRPKTQAGDRPTSHILTHVAAREEILQRWIRDGVLKQSDATGKILLVDQWDLFDINQIRQAAKYLALSMIYFALSDQKDDMYWLKSREYQASYSAAMKLAILSLDTNDDGKPDLKEEQAIAPQARFTR